ncbi:unnamed protein product, partial [Mesorhabditis belari]|uniref:Small integral membrane protein 14 n=1 Tax=Mesorhabditis belari TaxID=2138241 RepID=A0AAF3EB88_9BILA
MGDDPCACYFDHEAAMRRILSLLRDSQTECVDGNCDPAQLPGGPAGSLMLWTMLWGVLALALFFLRPRSLRQRPTDPPSKPGPNDDQGSSHDPPPGPGVQ